MKNIVYISILALTLFGCSKDMLDRTPITNKVIGNFYKTTDDAAQALTACYNVLTWEATTPIQLISDIASDELFGGAGASDGDGFVRYDRFVYQPDVTTNQSIWQQYYAGVSRANVLLENIDNVAWGTNKMAKTKCIAEAKFLRAYFYFNLTRLFGKVPLITKTVKASDIVTIASTDDIYKQIVSDLKFGADSLPATKFAANSADYGHVSKWAAESMLGRVFLFYTGYYNKTEVAGLLTQSQTVAYLEDVINNSGHGLVSDFASLWVVPAASTGVSYAGEGNKECVFAIKYSVAIAGGKTDGAGLWQRMIGPRSYNKAPYGQGWGAGTVNPAMWNAYTDGNDVRKKASILSWNDESRTYDFSDQRQYTGYNVKKYENYCQIDGTPYDVTLGSKDWQFDGYEDFMELRFADVLLMSAELQLTTDNSKALSYLTQVHTRAKAAAPVAATLSTILEERRLEFAFEGLRYWDLLRQCKGDFTALIPALNNATSDSKFFVDGKYAAHVKGLFQVPPAEISLMNLKESDFEQNTLYKDNTTVGKY